MTEHHEQHDQKDVKKIIAETNECLQDVKELCKANNIKVFAATPVVYAFNFGKVTVTFNLVTGKLSTSNTDPLNSFIIPDHNPNDNILAFVQRMISAKNSMGEDRYTRDCKDAEYCEQMLKEHNEDFVIYEVKHKDKKTNEITNMFIIQNSLWALGYVSSGYLIGDVREHTKSIIDPPIIDIGRNPYTRSLRAVCEAIVANERQVNDINKFLRD